MEILQIILLFLVFISIAFLMFLRKIPALLALPIMAFLFPVIAGVSPSNTIQLVLGPGATKLSEAYTIAIFGSMLSLLMQKTGIAENFIKIGAELSGDKPWTIAVIMLLLITLLFTTLGGLGAIIMVGAVVLPIMASAGIGSLTTCGIFLIGLSLGGTFNVGNWAVYTSVLGLTVNEVRTFAIIIFCITFIVALIYITVMLYKDGHDLNLKGIIFKSILFIFIVAGIYEIYDYIPQLYLNLTLDILKMIVALLIIAAFVYSFIRIILKKNENNIHWISYFTPIIPLLLILIFNLNFIAAFITGLLYGFISTYKKKGLNVLVRSILEGGSVVMPAVALMLGIGMLLYSVLGPPSSAYKEKVKVGAQGIDTLTVPSSFTSQKKDGLDILVKLEGTTKEDKPAYKWISNSKILITAKANSNVSVDLNNWPVLNILKPVFSSIIPKSKLSFIFIFMLMAPLALYRGPLNVWGMGFGMAAIFLASGMPPGSIMGLLLSVGQIQGISDPTNTQNVWLANEMRVDVQKILWNTIPYTWLIALIGLIASSYLFM